MTGITELAQSLKAAANTTADAIDRLKAFPGDELIDLSQHEGEQVDIDIATLNQWYELSSPANILALLEALEKTQHRIAELESRTVKMPEPFKLAKSSSGLTYYFADDVDAALTDAGIKVEAE
ncbi:TPA: hypothetical protein MFM39_005310 [Klebsiella pneumoniae]|nr:hypothetical protein [Klebsiella pneumoniae]